jgi:hypothetical protein
MSLTPTISAQIEVLIIQFNAIVKIMRTKKFKLLREIDNDAWWERRSIYEDRQFELQAEISRLSAGSTVEIWKGIFS